MESDSILVDKLSLDNLSELENRNYNLKKVINHKIYDTSHEDDIARYIINNTEFKDMLLIRFEYYLSKTYHGLGKGDMVFYDNQNDKLYVIELKSLKDKYSNITDVAKIEKCISQSIKYSKYTMIWANKKSTPVSVIEYLNGDIQITKQNIQEEIEQIETKVKFPCNFKKDEIDKWFEHPGDQTCTHYKIVGDTLEAIRIVDYSLPSSGSKRAFRKRVKKICKECSKCSKYLITLKNLQDDVLMHEFYDINEIDEF